MIIILNLERHCSWKYLNPPWTRWGMTYPNWMNFYNFLKVLRASVADATGKCIVIILNYSIFMIKYNMGHEIYPYMIHIDFPPSSRRVNCTVNYNCTFTPFFVTLCTRKFIYICPVSFKTITDIYKSTLSDRLYKKKKETLREFL